MDARDDSSDFDFGFCPNREEAVQRLVDGELSERESAELTAHLDECDGCRRFNAALTATRAAVRESFMRSTPRVVPAAVFDGAAARAPGRTRLWAKLVFGAAGLAAAAAMMAAMLFRGTSPSAAEVAWVHGDVSVTSVGGAVRKLTALGEMPVLEPGDIITCGDWSQAELTLDGGTKILVDRLTGLAAGRDAWELGRGRVAVSHPSGAPDVSVRTDDALVTTRGTEFEVRSSGGQTTAAVSRGEIVLRSTRAAEGEAGGAAAVERIVTAGHEGRVRGSTISVRKAAAIGTAGVAPRGARGATLLRYRLAEGDSWRWRVEWSIRLVPAVDGLGALIGAILADGPKETGSATEVDFRVQSVGDLGKSVMTVTGTGGGEARMEVDPLGRRRILGTGGGGSARSLLGPRGSSYATGLLLGPRLPAGAVRPGDTWEHSARSRIFTDTSRGVGVRLDLLVRHTLAEGKPGTNQIEIRSEIVRRNFELVDTARGTVLARATSKGVGSAVFDCLAGELIESSIDLETSIDPLESMMKELGGVRYTEKMRQRRVAAPSGVF